MLVTHTTGRSLPTTARKRGEYPTVTAVNYYSGSRGCHYVNGYRGHKGGDLLQMAHENEQAHGVGTSDQRASIFGRRWEKDLPPSLVERWKERWPGYANPLDLLPGTKTANSCCLHVECIPLTKEWIAKGFEPHGDTLFTYEQHRTVAALYCDVAKRNGWSDEWWRTPAMLGHEDLCPIDRHDRRGGWDPGWLRASPYFDWYLVVDIICADVLNRSYGGVDYQKLPRPDTKPKGYYGAY